MTLHHHGAAFACHPDPSSYVMLFDLTNRSSPRQKNCSQYILHGNCLSEMIPEPHAKSSLYRHKTSFLPGIPHFSHPQSVFPVQKHHLNHSISQCSGGGALPRRRCILPFSARSHPNHQPQREISILTDLLVKNTSAPFQSWYIILARHQHPQHQGAPERK